MSEKPGTEQQPLEHCGLCNSASIHVYPTNLSAGYGPTSGEPDAE